MAGGEERAQLSKQHEHAMLEDDVEVCRFVLLLVLRCAALCCVLR